MLSKAKHVGMRWHRTCRRRGLLNIEFTGKAGSKGQYHTCSIPHSTKQHFCLSSVWFYCRNTMFFNTSVPPPPSMRWLYYLIICRKLLMAPKHFTRVCIRPRTLLRFVSFHFISFYSPANIKRTLKKLQKKRIYKNKHLLVLRRI